MKQARIKFANNLAEVHRACQPRPLYRDELDEFFVSTADARDEHLVHRDRIRKILERNPDTQSKLLLAGHAGSGKSTELTMLVQELGERFFVVSFSVVQECNLVSVVIEDLLVVMMERLVSACQDAGMAGSFAKSKALEEIYAWFAHETQITEEQTELGTEAAAGVDVASSPLGKLVGLLGTWKNWIRHRSDRTRKNELIKPQRLSDLTARCNALINEVQLALQKTDKTLLVIVEDADKMNPGDARRIFIEQPRVLADLNTNLICTISIFLLHSPDRSETLEPLFKHLILPMPKVFEFDGSPCKKGRDAITQIIQRRMSMNLIEEDALELLINKTGGVLRDVFEVLVVAAEVAENMYERKRQPDARITEQNIRYGLNQRKNEYARSLSTIHLPAEWNVSNKDLYARLRELAPNNQRVLPTDHCAMVLLQAKAVIEYNGERWFAVHPLVKELIELMG